MVGPLAFYTIADLLLVDLGNRLAATSAGRPDREVLTVGLIADDEGSCGQLAVSIVRTYYSETPPAEASGFTAGTSGAGGPCELPYVTAELAVRVVRCAPGPDASGRPPSPQALDASVQTVETDAYHARLATTCVLQGLVGDGIVGDGVVGDGIEGDGIEGDGIEGFLVQSQPREGPSGGVVGSQVNLAVWLANVCADC